MASKLIMPKARRRSAVADLIGRTRQLGGTACVGHPAAPGDQIVYADGKSIGFLGADPAQRPSTRRNDDGARAADQAR
jgi:hypothetical protein